MAIMAKGKTSMTDAQKEAKFKELAGNRMNRILKGIASLSKLAATRYKYAPSQVDKMEKAFQVALNDCFARFKGAKQKESGFEF